MYHEKAILNKYYYQNILRRVTQRDQSLQQLKKVVEDGWPEKRGLLSDSAKPYFNVRDEITEVNGFLMKGDRVIVATGEFEKRDEGKNTRGTFAH